METFSALLAICAGNSPVPGEFTVNGWVNNGEAGDMRHHRAHNDVTVMVCECSKTLHMIKFTDSLKRIIVYVITVTKKGLF